MSSKVVVKNDKIIVLKEPLKPQKIPVGLVTIIPGVQLEIEGSFNEFALNIGKINIPLSLICKAKDSHRGFEVWDLQIETNSEYNICSIFSLEDKIISVQFNQKLAYDAEYRQSGGKLAILHKLTLGKSDSNNICSKGIKTLRSVMGLETTDFKIREFNRGISFTLNKHNIEYIFFTDKHGYMNLLSIGRAE